MEIVVSDGRKTVPIGRLGVGDTFMVKNNPTNVYIVTDEYGDDNDEIVLCVDLKSGVIQHWTKYNTEVIPVKSKLEVEYDNLLY